MKSQAEKQEKRAEIIRFIAIVVTIGCIVVVFVALAVALYSKLSYGVMLDEFQKSGTYSEDVYKIYSKHLETEFNCLAIVIVSMVVAFLTSMKFRFIKPSFLE